MRDLLFRGTSSHLVIASRVAHQTMKAGSFAPEQSAYMLPIFSEETRLQKHGVFRTQKLQRSTLLNSHSADNLLITKRKEHRLQRNCPSATLISEKHYCSLASYVA